jgi:hypothetical protein
MASHDVQLALLDFLLEASIPAPASDPSPPSSPPPVVHIQVDIVPEPQPAPMPPLAPPAASLSTFAARRGPAVDSARIPLDCLAAIARHVLPLPFTVTAEQLLGTIRIPVAGTVAGVTVSVRAERGRIVWILGTGSLPEPLSYTGPFLDACAHLEALAPSAPPA